MPCEECAVVQSEIAEDYLDKKAEHDRLTAENARLREALERIAMFQGVDSYGHVAIARQALKGGV